MRVSQSFIAVDLLPATEGRSLGLHASDLYGALYKALEPSRYSDDAGPNTLKMAIGVAWERYFEALLQSQGINAYRPGEFWTDGADTGGRRMAFSPDLIIKEGGVTRGGEIKATWMTDVGDITSPKFDKYRTQMAVYGHHLELPDWTLFVTYMDGNGRKPINPTFQVYDLTFTTQEMASEWQACLNNGRDVGLI